eukprot:TRINITY_DN622_c0_g2_i1.p3 TRINITY_DN622_c0_g2~~TRINITY_DN622_c0_g2_i1.p3  ORF type:complete len:223 (-),score=-35.40 TRINITY_DN622_c0_g2_i1:837-1505(-)
MVFLCFYIPQFPIFRKVWYLIGWNFQKRCEAIFLLIANLSDVQCICQCNRQSMQKQQKINIFTAFQHILPLIKQQNFHQEYFSSIYQKCDFMCQIVKIGFCDYLIIGTIIRTVINYRLLIVICQQNSKFAKFSFLTLYIYIENIDQLLYMVYFVFTLVLEKISRFILQQSSNIFQLTQFFGKWQVLQSMSLIIMKNIKDTPLCFHQKFLEYFLLNIYRILIN